MSKWNVCESLEKQLLKEWRECVESLTDLGPIQKRALIKRYSMILETLSSRRYWNSIGYTLIRLIVTTGSIAVPALLPIKQFDDEPDTENIIYWTTWGISLIVSLANGMMSLFKIDKTFFTAGQLFEKLQSEGWMYLTLSGEYSIKNTETATIPNSSASISSGTGTATGIGGGTNSETASNSGSLVGSEKEGNHQHDHSTMFSRFMERLERLYTRIIDIDYNYNPTIRNQGIPQGGSGITSLSPSHPNSSVEIASSQFEIPFSKERQIQKLYSVSGQSEVSNSRRPLRTFRNSGTSGTGRHSRNYTSMKHSIPMSIPKHLSYSHSHSHSQSQSFEEPEDTSEEMEMENQRFPPLPKSPEEAEPQPEKDIKS
jgi:hypothetical protein